MNKDVMMYLMLAAIVLLTVLNIMVFDSRQNTPLPAKQVVKEVVRPPGDGGGSDGLQAGEDGEGEAVIPDGGEAGGASSQPAPGSAGELEKRLADMELVDVQAYDPSLEVDMRYGTRNNFLGVNMYNGFGKCYLQPEVARMFSKAQEYLKERYPRYSLKALDCTRPRSVQQLMWDRVKGTEQQKYVAAPYPGSIHNYGAGIDVTIVDGNGRELDMGTPFDYFGEEAQPRYHKEMLEAGKLSNEEIQNRLLLKEVMKSAGFRAILTEWWHFEAFDKNMVREKYKIIE